MKNGAKVGCVKCGLLRDEKRPGPIYVMPGYQFEPCELGREPHEWGEILVLSVGEPLTLAR